MLTIVRAPYPTLSQIAKPVTKIDAGIHALIKGMKETLNATTDPEGVGLAAPQVGKSLQLFIVKPTPKSPITVYINPDLIGVNPHIIGEDTEKTQKGKNENNKEKGKEKKLEGCLSLQNIWGEVKRTPSTTLKYTDENGVLHEKTFKGFLATILQHEYDHLQGILFPKRVLEQQGILYKSSKNTKGEDEFEEIEI